MIAWKGVSKDMKGHGGYVFKVGGIYEEKEAKTVRSGFHCTENPLACLTYFPLGMGNRYLMVSAKGDINEDGNERIACTRIEILREVSWMELALQGMQYIVEHPEREDWKRKGCGCAVSRDTAEAPPGGIAIARGRNPMAKGPEGSFLGLLMEGEDGSIVRATAVLPGKRLGDGRPEAKAETWYRFGPEGAEEAQDET